MRQKQASIRGDTESSFQRPEFKKKPNHDKKRVIKTFDVLKSRKTLTKCLDHINVAFHEKMSKIRISNFLSL